MPISAMPPAAGVYLIFLVFLCGACGGSFVNCAASRRVRGEKLARGRSHCMACGHTLGVRDLAPIVSWLCLRGKCRFCGEKISARYPLTELLLALAFTAAAVRFGLSQRTVEYCLLFALLLLLALIDLETMEIPDFPLAFGALLWAVCLPLEPDPLKSLTRGLLGGLLPGGLLLLFVLLMDKLMKRETMGGGDIKLFAMLGLYAGPAVDLVLVLASCLLGLVFGRVRARRGQPFPFGPTIAAAAVPALLWGPALVEWYMGLFI